MKLETIGNYTFGMAGTAPDASDFYEVAMMIIENHETKLNYPAPTDEPKVYIDSNDDENEFDIDLIKTMHITTQYHNYIIGDMVEHDVDTSENYCTFTLTKQID